MRRARPLFAQRAGPWIAHLNQETTVSKNVPTPTTTVTTHPGDIDCPTWCSINHDPFENTIPEPLDELCHHSRSIDVDDMSVQISQAGTDPEPLVFLTVDATDALHVRSTVARRLGQALIDAADTIDEYAREWLARTGIVVASTPNGITVRLTDDCDMDAEQRDRFKQAMQLAGAEILADIRTRSER
jgi:hypothetical protein